MRFIRDLSICSRQSFAIYPECLAMVITGTVVKEWFQYYCERKARYASMGKVPKADSGDQDVRAPISAWAMKGLDYETRVLRSLTNSLVSPNGASLRQYLSGERRGFYAQQVEVRPSCNDLGLPQGVRIGTNRLDLIRHDTDGDRDFFTVIDIKATRRATRFHRAQVAFYAILLDSYLREGRLAGRASHHGEIWRIPDNGSVEGAAYEVETFALAPYRRMVLEFLTSIAPSIAESFPEGGEDKTPFHVYFKCEECAYLGGSCLASVSMGDAAARDVSAVAGMSHHTKRQLIGQGIATVGALSNARGVVQSDGASWSLKRKLGALVERARSISGAEVRRTSEPYSMLMPGRVGTRILLSVDVDPVDDMLVALGCAIERADGTRAEEIVVIPTARRSDEVEALKRVFGVVLRELQAIAANNDQGGSDGAQAILAHIYLYEPSEAVAIQAAVKRHIDDPGVRATLLELIRMFPPDNVVAEPEYRGANHLPATAVRSVVEHLYALPVSVSYDLRQVTQVLAKTGAFKDPYVPAPGFGRPFSSLLSIEVARGIKGEAIEGYPIQARHVVDDVRARLRALSGLCGWLERESARNATPDGGALLRLPKKPFRFWRQFDPLNAGDLDVLQAFELMQARASMLGTLVGLARPPAARTASGRSLTGLSYMGRVPASHGRVALEFDVPRDARDTEVGPGSFGLIVTNGAYDVLLDPLAWAGFECSVRDLPRSGSRIVVEMNKANYESPPFQAMLRESLDKPDWCIDGILKDPNTPRIARYLRHLEGGA